MAIKYLNQDKQPLSAIIHHMKYARYLPELQRRESWEETVERNKQMHLAHYADRIKDYPQLKKDIIKVYDDFVLTGKVLPSMRSFQFGGQPIEINPTRIYNCSFFHIDHPDAFSEGMFLLLSGVGTGYSVQKHHIDALPGILGVQKQEPRRYLVADSIEGWADAVKTLVESYFHGKPEVDFDLRGIRPKGARLITSGGKAPGPEPLRQALVKIRSIFENALQERGFGTKLKPIEAHDIMCHIADAVLSGGIRRAAMIALFNFNDEEMLEAKFGNWWEHNPQRGRANNSAVAVRDKITEEDFWWFWKKVEASKAGEPGIFFTNDSEWGLNPCAEISLHTNQFCNLSTMNAATIESQEDLEERVWAATLLGTLQAGYTNFHYLRPVWKRTTEKEALLGVSMTGVASGKVMSFDLKKAASLIKGINKEYAAMIGINPAARLTSIKPEGCGILSTKIRTTDGEKTYAEIFKLSGYDPEDYIGAASNGVWLSPKSPITVYDEHNEERVVTSLFVNGMADVYTFETEDGESHSFTAAHKFLTQRGWVSVIDLQVGDDIKSFNVT